MKLIFEQPVTASMGTTLYQVLVHWRNGTIVADEPVSLGGQDKGPDPYSLLMASLASCTLSTLRMYIDRKAWDIPNLSVELNMYQEIKNQQLQTTILRQIHFEAAIDAEQKERLLQIAQACPISKILKGAILIETNTF